MIFSSHFYVLDVAKLCLKECENLLPLIKGVANGDSQLRDRGDVKKR